MQYYTFSFVRVSNALKKFAVGRVGGGDNIGGHKASHPRGSGVMPPLPQKTLNCSVQARKGHK